MADDEAQEEGVGPQMQDSLKATFQAVVEQAMSNGLLDRALPRNEINIGFRDQQGFPKAVAELESDPTVVKHYGRDVAGNLALRLSYVLTEKLQGKPFDQATFDEAWNTCVKEIKNPAWTYVAIAHIQNLETYTFGADLGEEINYRVLGPSPGRRDDGLDRGRESAFPRRVETDNAEPECTRH